MFTGIVTNIGSVIGVADRNDVRRMTISCDYDLSAVELGSSMACNGVCFTIVAREKDEDGKATFDVEAAAETIKTTTVSAWDIGTRLNLERPLKVGDELGGHYVSGHVDGVATIVEREDLGESTRFDFTAPPELARLVAAKGSVALDGTSLTVNKVEGNRFSCLLIPHTLQVTTWNGRKVGDHVNLEVDTIARYVARLQETA
jgi:riboflavin synthase